MRVWLLALALAAIAGNAAADRETLVAQGWSVGSVEEIAAANPNDWSYLAERDALRGSASGLICPESLSNVQLYGVKAGPQVSECWYQSGEREGLWTVSVTDPDGAREILARNYDTIPTDPDIELAPIETSSIGACDLEIRRMRNVHGFWVTVRDLYTADSLHQFRTITYDHDHRARMDTLAQEALDLSVATKCAGTS